MPRLLKAAALAAILALAAAAEDAPAQAGGNVFAKYQGDAEKAVDLGLEFLASAQRPDGSFPGQYGESTGVTSLVGMAFLSKGHLPGLGPHGHRINLCIDYALANQNDQGVFASRGHGNGVMYAHNISALFLSEVSGMVDPERQKRIEPALGKAIKVILDAQAVEKVEQHRGGWRYQPDSKDSDLSCSGWALMALRSAKLNGAPVPDSAIADAVEYLFRCHDAKGGTFGYQDGRSHANTLTGAGLLCLELCGFHGDPATFAAGEYIIATCRRLPGAGHEEYGNYYNAQAMFQLGGKYWEQYADFMYPHYLDLQNPDGSWGKVEGNNPPICYETSMMILALAVPYRQLPIYQRDETVDE
ncbi:MAG: prenyltransferase/squalene oxidase repeat-containing protein [Verrucomicrobiales bacterium]